MVISFITLCYSDMSRNFKEKQNFATENKIPALPGNLFFLFYFLYIFLNIE